jgi:hypothetical protein
VSLFGSCSGPLPFLLCGCSPLMSTHPSLLLLDFVLSHTILIRDLDMFGKLTSHSTACAFGPVHDLWLRVLVRGFLSQRREYSTNHKPRVLSSFPEICRHLFNKPWAAHVTAFALRFAAYLMLTGYSPRSPRYGLRSVFLLSSYRLGSLRPLRACIVLWTQESGMAQNEAQKPCGIRALHYCWGRWAYRYPRIQPAMMSALGTTKPGKISRKTAGRNRIR